MIGKASWVVGFLLLGAMACTKPEVSQTVSEETAKQADAALAAADPIEGYTGPADLAHANRSCRICRHYNCSDVEGFDVVRMCFTNPDPSFVEQCIAARNCMTQNHCGLGPQGTVDCFCGTTPNEACLMGQAPPNGPCIDVFTKAGRQKNLDDFMSYYDIMTVPMGVAHALRVCDKNFCPDCIEKGPTAPKQP